ncbi:MAG: pyridoxamine 5'-phosphate oxidase family protein [Halieaceae bacterium]|nr:pyridoxamine 5'-phosphate oxidase family protein [Halieaceae bacterium]
MIGAEASDTSVVIAGPWDHEQVRQYLDDTTFPLRLACVASDGFPRVVSLWYRYQQGSFYCVTHRDSKLTKLLRRNHKVGFEVSPNEPPYYGVRGQGLVTLAEQGGAAMLQEHLQRYLGGTESGLAQWLLSRAEEELLVQVQVTRMFSWDYRQRMEGAR